MICILKLVSVVLKSIVFYGFLVEMPKIMSMVVNTSSRYFKVVLVIVKNQCFYRENE